MSALQEQIGGQHYKDMPIQVVEFNHKNNIPYMEGSVIKYVCRWRKKNGIEDLLKAKHYIDLIIELEKKYDTIAYKSHQFSQQKYGTQSPNLSYTVKPLPNTKPDNGFPSL